MAWKYRPRTPYQEGLTVITRVVHGKERLLTDVLQHIGGDIENNLLVPFLQLETVHFARWLMLPASEDALGRSTPSYLVFSSNFDEPVSNHLSELYDKASAGLNELYSCCDGYPPSDQRTKESVLRYIRHHNVGYNTLYVGTWGRTVMQIHREALLRDRIQKFLDQQTRHPAFLQQSAEKIRLDIQDHVRSQPDLQWTAEKPLRPMRRWYRPRDLTAFATAIALLLLIFFLPGALLLSVAAGLIILRRKEVADKQHEATTNFAQVAQIAQKEDRFVQNQMSSVTNIKPGWFRLAVLRTVLWAIDLAGRYVYTEGKLGNIPSIHFARWVVIDGGRRLIFFSNFDGTWENYMGDFIDKAATGLTAVWGNTDGFPKSRWLILDGATDEQRFKAYARNSQVVTQVWYSAYKNLTVQNINNNSVIRAGLFSQQTPDETAAWLQLL